MTSLFVASSTLPSNTAETSQITALGLYHRRTRTIEKFTQTVKEVWVGNQLSKILVTDTTQQFETEQEFISTHSTHEPVSRNFTARVMQVQREYPC